MKPREIQVWNFELDTLPARQEMLSAEERGQAERFRFERDRVRFINAHRVLREILGRETNTSPQMLGFQTNEYGKPALMNEPGLGFNLSHSQDRGLVAVARGVSLGADIEQRREGIEVMDLAQRFFAPREVELVHGEPQRFFEMWTRKEAFIKAIGMGVAFPLKAFDVCEEQVVIHPEGERYTSEVWFVQSFVPAPGFEGAVAVNRRDMLIALENWTGTL